jgi:cytochrome c oxidase subunit 2
LDIRLILISNDVIHSFAVPLLGINLDCALGRSNQVSLLIDREGTFNGQCSEICGLNAPKLKFIELYCMLKN